MATKRQITANRKNAQKSTGPKTGAGKMTSKLNALAHGLLAAEILLPDEDESVFRQFQQVAFDHFTPANDLESEFVERIVGYLWRLSRCRRIETNLLGGGAQVMGSILLAGRQSYVDDSVKKTDIAPRPGEELSEDELLKRIKMHGVDYDFLGLNKKEKQQNPLTYDIALGFSESTSKNDMLSKLARYETSLDRALYRCLHELQRLQAIRLDRPGSAPPMVDLNITIEDS